MQKSILKSIQSQVPRTENTIWILSSGTSSTTESLKAVGLSRDAILASAAAVNFHLSANSRDKWLLAIPQYHIGGFSIWARAHLSGASVYIYEGEWNPASFVDTIKREWITLTSLVPTQVFDLVAAGLECPPSLRAAVIGGGRLDAELYFRARKLRWPVLPSYGLTECASQVATASLSSLGATEAYPALQLLRHVEAASVDGRIRLRSPSLCKWIAIGMADGPFTLEDPVRAGGWMTTEDRGEVRGGSLSVTGRLDDVVKILGVLVTVPAVEQAARKYFAAAGLTGEVAVLARPAGREGSSLVLVTDSKVSLGAWNKNLQSFNQKQPGPERITQLCWIPRFPRGELGKLKRGELLSRLKLQ